MNSYVMREGGKTFLYLLLLHAMYNFIKFDGVTLGQLKANGFQVTEMN